MRPSASGVSILGVSVSQFEAVDETLLLLSEARERAERAAREIVASDGAQHVVDALERVDRELLTVHRRLMDEAVLGVVPREADTQLALDAA